MNSRLIKVPPPRIAMSLVVASVILHWVAPASIAELPVMLVPAIILGLTGFLIMMIAWWQFRQHYVAICPTAATSKLLTAGIYRYTRNPMYLGIVVMMTSLAVGVGSVILLAAAAVFFAVVWRVFCPYEEQKLLEAFGNDYVRYAAGVRRWL